MIKIKKLFLAVVIGAMLVTNTSNAFAVSMGERVNINVNGQRIFPDSAPFIKDSRTMVPLSGVFQSMGAGVQWIESERKVIVSYGKLSVVVYIADKRAYVNGVQKQMDVAPVIVNNRTMIPLSFISQYIGMSVKWVPEARLATVTDPGYFDTVGNKTTVLGFSTNDYKGDSGSYNSIVKNSTSINSIATFSYRVNSAGNLELTGESQQNSVKYANNNNIKPLMLVHNFKDMQFDKNLAHSVLADKAKRKKLIDNIVITMSREEYSGVNIDIENVYGADRAYYTSLIKELKERLTPFGYLTTVSIPAKTVETSANNNWSGAFDYAAIGRYADQVMLMTYDEHYFGGSAGSVASYTWVKNVLEYATAHIPSEKLLLGIAGYGYDWSSKGNKVVNYRNVGGVLSKYNVKSQWDETSKSPYFIYYENGVKHEVWYENHRSLGFKLDLAVEYKLGGIGLWKLGYEDDAFWDVVDSKLD